MGIFSSILPRCKSYFLSSKLRSVKSQFTVKFKYEICLRKINTWKFKIPCFFMSHVPQHTFYCYQWKKSFWQTWSMTKKSKFCSNKQQIVSHQTSKSNDLLAKTCQTAMLPIFKKFSSLLISPIVTVRNSKAEWRVCIFLMPSVLLKVEDLRARAMCLLILFSI